MTETRSVHHRLARRTASAIGVTIAAIALSGCATASHAQHHQHKTATRAVVVKSSHTHSARCGHYRHKGNWYHLKNHVHGKRCGHAHVKGVWVVR